MEKQAEIIIISKRVEEVKRSVQAMLEACGFRYRRLLVNTDSEADLQVQRRLLQR